MCEQGGKSGRAGTFGNGFLYLGKHGDRPLEMLLLNKQDVIDKPLADLSRQNTDFPHGNAFGDGRPAHPGGSSVQGRMHAWIHGCLHTNNPGIGFAAFCCDRHAADKAALEAKVAAAKGDATALAAAEAALAKFPADEAAYTKGLNAEKGLAARANPPRAHAEPFPGKDEAAKDKARRNFLALIFCLMVGTAALPHILMRFYTTPSVREARNSVTWSLFFIFLLYFTAPALAVLVKFVMYNDVVGSSFATLPAWVANWKAVDPGLLSVVDVNLDGIVQLSEIKIGNDIVVLATPEIAGLPYVVSGMVAAGGLAAALSTADGLLLTMANALSHDVYYKTIDPNAPVSRRVMISKSMLLIVAVLAALVAQQKPADILFLVGAAFSFAAAGFFPALVLGIFWKRTTGIAASLGMLAGIGICFYYMSLNQPWLREVFYGIARSVPTAPTEWFGISAISAGIFGIPLGFAVIIIVSLITPAPSREVQDMVSQVRYPDLKMA